MFGKSKLIDNILIVRDMKNKNIWNENCPVLLENLSLLSLSYLDFSGSIKNDGQMIVHNLIADQTIQIFKTLLNLKFPLKQIKLMNIYNGNDDLAMEDNNSSAFNSRYIEGTKRFSIHAYGLAIDINPVQNPVILEKTIVKPKEGNNYLNRKNIRIGMVENILENGQTIIDIFKQNGLGIWGGEWNNPIDYHHFQTTREYAESIADI